MNDKKRLILNLLEMSCVRHITHLLQLVRENKEDPPAAVDDGRTADSIKIVVGAEIVVGRTDAQSAEKLALYQRQTSPDWDPVGYPPETRVADIAEAASGRGWRADNGDPDETGEDLLRDFDTFAGIARSSAATRPSKVAGEIETRVDKVGFDTAKDFIELVIPRDCESADARPAPERSSRRRETGSSRAATACRTAITQPVPRRHSTGRQEARGRTTGGLSRDGTIGGIANFRIGAR